MRVLFVSANYGGSVVGGGQQSIREVASELLKEGHAVAVAYIDRVAGAPTVDQDGVLVYALPPKNFAWHRSLPSNFVLRAAWHIQDRFFDGLNSSLADVINDFRPDVVHTNVLGGVGTAIWQGIKNADIPVVHSVHDYYLICQRSAMRRGAVNCAKACKSCRAITKLNREQSELVDAVIYVSDHMRAVHEAHQLFINTPVVEQVIGAFECIPLSATPKALPKRLNVGYIGRISPDKGLDELMRALESCSDIVAQLTVAGTGDPAYIESLQAKYNNLDVRWLGKVLPENFYSVVDVVAVPSVWNEPAGRVAFEAGLLGVPVIVSAVGGLPQMVGYGDRGLICDFAKTKDFRRCLLDLINNPALLDLFYKNWDSVRSEFSRAAMTKLTLSVYDRLVLKVHAENLH